MNQLGDYKPRQLFLIATIFVICVVHISISTPSISGFSHPTVIRGADQLYDNSSVTNQTSVTFTIVVGRSGFNGTSDTFNITVQQGASVTLIFLYGDKDLPDDNPHQITIDGYNIQTALINRSNPTVTLQFTANQPGSFSFYCISNCTGMDSLQSGTLNVTPTGT